MHNTPVLGVIGGSGLYAFEGLTNITEHDLTTPFGKPSAPIIVGEIDEKPVAFLARHGIGHHLSPSEVNYRANIYAFKMLGINKVISVSACGSLREDFAPGNIVVPDQIFDFTHKRERSFFGEGLVVHVSVADPFCNDLSALLYQSLQAVNATAHKGGTYITIEGPRFSTRGESNLYRAWGMSVIGMTAAPELFLAREAEMCYATMAHVTDYDVWHTSEEAVTVDMVIKTLLQNTHIAQAAIRDLVNRLSDDTACACQAALKDAVLTDKTKISAKLKSKYQLLAGKYL